MQQVANFFRQLVNISVSGILLMMAVVNLNATINLPKHVSILPISADNAMSLLIYIALVLVTGLFAWSFWQRRAADKNLLVSILNGTAFALLVGAVIYDVVAR